MTYMYIWRKGILTQYSNGIVVAVADDIDKARIMILDKFWKQEIVDTGYENYEDDEWPKSEYYQLEKALNEEPEILSIPGCVYKYGGE